ncbi:MAG: hypothetical protein ACM3TN_28810 [Alphaproteobacteria bacterium]
MGRVIVEFPDCREVLVDGKSQGNNRNEEGAYRILILGDGLHTFRLGGQQNYTPLSQLVEVGASGSVILPQHVVFQKVP